jgi:S1-C subfamily serine protease
VGATEVVRATALIISVGCLAVAGCGFVPQPPEPAPAGSAAQTPSDAASPMLRRSELRALGDKVAPSLVDVDTELGYQGAQGAGTGIVLSADGEVLTNNHVINGATSITVTDLGDQQTYRAQVVGYDRAKDVAVLRLHDASDLTTAALGDSTQATPGDAVAAIGNAGGTNGPPTVAGGTVTALDRSVSPTDELTGASEQLTGLIEVAASVQPGDSGGPLVDRDGRVIGVDTAASTNYRYQSGGGTGFAIPINNALAIERQIDAGQASDTVHVGPTAILGVQVISTPDGDPVAAPQDQADAAGVPVTGVELDSPAAEAGLHAGDQLTGLDSAAVDSATTLIRLLGHHHPGDHVTLRWTDTAGQQHSTTTTLATGPPA